ncbi:hypothetical protein P3342_012826 [Pyrenophora teres f. teres]|nr:hypothetical protein P3342_012826 [Pyrenophora teres f. teres]
MHAGRINDGCDASSRRRAPVVAARVTRIPATPTHPRRYGRPREYLTRAPPATHPPVLVIAIAAYEALNYR